MGWGSFDGPLLQGQTRIAKLKGAYNSLIIGSRVCDGKPTFWKAWAENLLVCGRI